MIHTWDVVRENVNRSMIKRFPYRALLGVSLTRFLIELRNRGLSAEESFNVVLSVDNVRVFLEFSDPLVANRFKHSLWISVCSRYSESEMYKKNLLEA
jgi:hypothetical protein